MEQIASKDMLRTEAARTLNPSVRRLRKLLTKHRKEVKRKNALGHLAGPKKRIYEEVFSLIYECSSNQSAAKTLIDRILGHVKR